jgi:hypothetical protein
MSKKIKNIWIICIIIVFIVGCARSSVSTPDLDGPVQSEQSDSKGGNNNDSGSGDISTLEYKAIWRNFGSDVGASNYLTDAQSIPDLVSLTEQGLDGEVTATPLILKNKTNNSQYVFLLVYTSGTEMTLQRWDYTGSGSIVKSTEFEAPIFDLDEPTHKAHQMVLHVEGEVPYIYVAHDKGVAKVNATNGTTEIFANTDLTNIKTKGILIDTTHTNAMYVQSKNDIYKYEIEDGEIKEDGVLLSGSSTMDLSADQKQFPMLVTQDKKLYMVNNNAVEQYDVNGVGELDTFEVPNFDSSKQTVIYTGDNYNKKISGVIVVDNKVLMAVTVESIGNSLGLGSTMLTNVFVEFDEEGNNPKYVEDYTEIMKGRSGSSYIGSEGHTALMISDAALFLPGTGVALGGKDPYDFSPDETAGPTSFLYDDNNNSYVDILGLKIGTNAYTSVENRMELEESQQHRLAGVWKIKRNTDDTLTYMKDNFSFWSNKKLPLISEKDDAEDIIKFNTSCFYQVPMFVLGDKEDRLLGVFSYRKSRGNSADNLLNQLIDDGEFAFESNNNTTRAETQICSQTSGGDTTCIDLPDATERIQAISVGDGMVVMVGDKNKLYIGY